MIHLSLPFFIENLTFNNFFKNYIIDNPDELKLNISIDYVYGAFPWSSWNGGLNSNKGLAFCYNEMENLILDSTIPLRIDCSNCFLNQLDYFDIHQNVILDLLKNSSNIIEISDLNLLNYIKNKNFNLLFIFSRNAEIYQEFSSEILNVLISQEDISLINLSSMIECDNKNKLELTIGDFCSQCSKTKQLYCIETEQNNQLNFSNKTIYFNCPYSKSNYNYLEDIENALKNGITHFKIAPSLNDINLDYFNYNLIKNFIKEEYQDKCFFKYCQQKG